MGTPAASPSQHLYDEVKRLDAVLSEAFNKHDVNKLKSLFADDLEFYQDNEGLVRYEQTVRDFESMFAQGNNMTRELVGNTLEVYPVKDYGAIEIGAHRFCHVENGKNECGTFRFVHIWQKRMANGKYPGPLVTPINVRGANEIRFTRFRRANQSLQPTPTRLVSSPSHD